MTLNALVDVRTTPCLSAGKEMVKENYGFVSDTAWLARYYSILNDQAILVTE